MHSFTFLDFTERQGRCKVAEWLQKIRAAVVQVCGCHFISRSSKSLFSPPYRWSSNGNYGAGLGVRILSSQFLLQPVIAQAADPVSSKLCGAISVLCLWRGDEEGWGLCVGGQTELSGHWNNLRGTKHWQMRRVKSGALCVQDENVC